MIHSDNDFATVAFLRIKNATLEPKLNQSDSFSLQIPPLLEDEFIDIRDFMEGFGIVAHSSESWPQGAIETLPLEALIDKGTQSKKVGAWISVANIERTIGSPLAEISLEDEVKECFHILQGPLRFPSLKRYAESKFRPPRRVWPQCVKLYKHQYIPLLDRLIRQRKHYLCHVFRLKPTCPRLCCRRPSLSRPCSP